jgi:proteic killer suppression protein
MEITFSSARLQKLCNNAGKLKGKYGPRLADLIRTRLADLDAADSLADMRVLPGRCHELTGDLAGHLAVDLVHPDRLVFRPSNKPAPKNSSGSLEWQLVTAIEIVAIGDYHS